jgi:choline dehydrogenase-like flavoprotein
MNSEICSDVVIIGGGSCGAVLAARLSEDPALQVCLLEAGGEDARWYVDAPLALSLTVPSRLFNWAFQTEFQSGLAGRRGYQPRGKGLGGSSSINAQIYIRGHPTDYDHWAELGNPGWSWADVLPYFRRSERNERFDDEYHGQGGPLHVADIRSPNPFSQRMIEAAVAQGLTRIEDFSGVHDEGVGWYQVTQKDGERWNVARAYLGRPGEAGSARNRPNLRVITGARVLKITLDGQQVTGAVCQIGGAPVRVKANRQVIVSAGALQTPQLLMLSGIGDPDVLSKFGISSVLDLPGVGRNLQDHIDCALAYRRKATGLIGLGTGLSAEGLRAWRDYRDQRRGMFTSNVNEAGAFVRTLPGLPAPDVQMVFAHALSDNHGRTPRWGSGFAGHVCVLRPHSVGRVSLASADPMAPPLIDPAFLSDERDMDTLLRGVKWIKRIVESPMLHEGPPVPLFDEPLQTDDDLRQFIRGHADTLYHPVGTCRMGSDPMAVVDARLQVHGIHGLRIVDCSVMPTVPGGNTNAPAVMIAEKAVEFIRQDLRAA